MLGRNWKRRRGSGLGSGHKSIIRREGAFGIAFGGQLYIAYDDEYSSWIMRSILGLCATHGRGEAK